MDCTGGRGLSRSHSAALVLSNQKRHLASSLFSEPYLYLIGTQTAIVKKCKTLGANSRNREKKHLCYQLDVFESLNSPK